MGVQGTEETRRRNGQLGLGGGGKEWVLGHTRSSLSDLNTGQHGSRSSVCPPPPSPPRAAVRRAGPVPLKSLPCVCPPPHPQADRDHRAPADPGGGAAGPGGAAAGPGATASAAGEARAPAHHPHLPLPQGAVRQPPVGEGATRGQQPGPWTVSPSARGCQPRQGRAGRRPAAGGKESCRIVQAIGGAAPVATTVSSWLL